MLLADVCGYGSLSAQMADQLRALMRKNVNCIQQSHFVYEMSRRLEHASVHGGFASALISTYFAPTRSFAVCNAGHPPPLLFRGGEGKWSVLKHVPAEASPAGAPLGVVDHGEYQQFEMKLEVGDMVLSYSNVLTECRTASGSIVGLEGLLSRLQLLDAQHPEFLVDDLVRELRGEHADNLAADDATVLLCRATETRVAWRDTLLAPFRLLRAVSDKTRIR
jgi:serine phosphatase RsbU (regulator of sigma subunit)